MLHGEKVQRNLRESNIISFIIKPQDKTSFSFLSKANNSGS